LHCTAGQLLVNSRSNFALHSRSTAGGKQNRPGSFALPVQTPQYNIIKYLVLLLLAVILQTAMANTKKLCAVVLSTLGREVMVRRPCVIGDDGWPAHPDPFNVTAGQVTFFSLSLRSVRQFVFMVCTAVCLYGMYGSLSLLYGGVACGLLVGAWRVAQLAVNADMRCRIDASFCAASCCCCRPS
jgi:hypothetical protein